MSSSVNQQEAKNQFLKPNKNIEINMSSLSTAQKQMCLKLLAQSNINFEQAQEKNCFEAELKIDPTKLTSQFTVQKQPEPNVSPIKNRQPNANKKSNKKPKQNQQNISNITFNKNQMQKPQAIAKQPPNPIYTSSKKSLSKTVKLNLLTQLEMLYPMVELYVYPKKMQFHSLVALIEEVYDLYWNVEINKQKPKQKIQEKEFSFDNKSGYNNEPNTKNYKPKQARHKSVYMQQKQSQSCQVEQKLSEKKTFCSWVYENFIGSQKQKIKIQQLMVSLIQSLNHFSYKHLGVQLFYNFLSGAYNLQTLNYYLVIRALLQQIEGQKIIQKVSSYGSKAGVLYKMKLNPYNKVIEEEKVLQFLQVCCQGSLSNQSRQDQTMNKVFQEMTQHMFFDQKKKKNFINYFEMVQLLLRQFLKVQTVNTTNLQLSHTQDHSQLNDFLLQQQLNAMMSGQDKVEQELELTFEVQQNEEGQSQCYRQQQYYIQQHSDAELNEYLPNYYSRQLQVENKNCQEDKDSFERLAYGEICKKYDVLRKSLFGNSQKEVQLLQSKNILDTLYAAVVKRDKKTWTELMTAKKLAPQRQSQQLHFIQKLQIQFDRIKQSNILSNDFLRKMLTVPYLRQAIVKQAGISFTNY